MTLLASLQSAATAGHVLPSTLTNLTTWLSAGLPAWAMDSLTELVTAEAWGELNDRFYRDLEFGTGGMRGRTIGRISTIAEQGSPSPLGTPAHAAIGSNILNDYTLVRAVIGLFRHTASYLTEKKDSRPPSLVIAHDVRHFSSHFSQLAASTWSQLGGQAYVFSGPRSTPQLSFTVRWLGAQCGVVITASHNPPHDNGFKAYFDDGAQVVAPHDKGIVTQVGQVPLADLAAFLVKDLSRVVTLGEAADEAYRAAAATAVIDASVFTASGLKVAFTSIHGVGNIQSIPLLRATGIEVHEEPAQAIHDPRFPTVKSPNPENAEALARAVQLAEEKGLDLVMATDPDCDRVGAAVRGRDGKMHLITGNQIGALMTEYRISRYKERGVIPRAGSDRVALVKTFVTTALQDEIARSHGVKVVNTLTGFKWIAAKIRGYEEALKAGYLAKHGVALDYNATPFLSRARLLQEFSTFYVFGCEESYGYLANDLVRDKDGNSACLMLAEVCAYVKGRGLTVPDYLDEIYLRTGYFLEGVINLYFEGATGAAKIKRIIDGYRAQPPRAFGEVAVTRFEDFGRMDIRDADGEWVPKQDLYQVTLANGYTFAARGSGTEPKMKFYVFAKATVASAAGLPAVKAAVAVELNRIKALIEADALARAEG
ncbi:MAG: phospho-sugar mutase [Verrucomicrobia bacterium]|nr:MAG: phospho-sugar mutase [Verrucomicrobiota bacterium]